MCSRKWLIVALVACGLASACSEFNTNLTVQTSSSTLVSLSPAQVTVGGTGFTITATGAGFVSGAVILWNSNSASPISLTTTFVSGSTLTAPVPASYLTTTATIAVAIDIPGSATSGTTSTSATTTTEVSNLVFFQINPAPPPGPTVGSISASTTSQNSAPYCSTNGFTLTVNGTNFDSTSVVNWNGSPRATTLVSATKLTAAILPTDTAFQVPVVVSVSNSSASNSPGTSNASTFTLLTPPANLVAPGIASLSQTSVAIGSPALSLTVTGSDILPCSVVQWVSGANAPVALTTTYVSGTQLMATVPASDFQALGSGQVVVFTVGPGGGTSGALSVTIVPPAVTSLSSSVPACSATSFPLTVTGTNFVNGTFVNWNGSPRLTSYVSPTQLTATITAADAAFPGTASVSVSTLTVNSNSLPFNTTAPAAALPVPAVTMLSPAQATAGTAAFTLNVFGSNFVPCSVVQWNGFNRATTVVSATQLTASISAADIAGVGSATVTVFNITSGGGGGASSGIAFPIVAPAITSLSSSTTALPSTPYCAASGLTLQVNGTNFTNSLVVNWNGSPRVTAFVSSTQLNATITAADTAFPGTANITVSSSPTVISNAMPFTMVSPATQTPPGTLIAPTITSLTPANWNAGAPNFPGLQVNDDSTQSMLPCSVVQWNGSARTTVFIGTTGLTASISAADVANPGMIPVTVFTPLPGGGTSNALRFTIFAPPFPAVRSAAVDRAASAVSVSGDLLSLPLSSADNRFSVFVLASADGVTETAGTFENIFVRDACTGAPSGCTPSVALASTGINSNPADGNSISPSISADGRYVTFISSASNLVASDTNGVADVFVRDTCAGAASGCTPSTQRVSVAGDGTQANGESTSAAISANGRYVTFVSSATNLAPVSSSASGIFLRDTCAGVEGCTPSTQGLQ